jgi:dynein heavy chain, axonemal
MQVTAMISAEGERVPLCRAFNPKRAEGLVERWLIDCEELMLDTVRASINDALKAFANTARVTWALQWPGQAVLVVDGLCWTREVRDFTPINLLRLGIVAVEVLLPLKAWRSGGSSIARS